MMIYVEHLTKQYGNKLIFHNINLHMTEGVIYGLVGENGCGKTTLMRCICGFSRPTKGKVTVLGKVIGKDVDFAPSTGIIIETPGFLSQYNARQNLSLLAGISGRATHQQIDEVIRLMGLKHVEKRPVGKYSLGMIQRLGFAQALMENPKVLILDEPFNALDKAAMQEVHGLLQQFKEQGNTVLLASHSAADIEKACDVVYEMENGGLKQIKGQ